MKVVVQILGVVLVSFLQSPSVFALGFVSRCENPISENEIRQQVTEQTQRLFYKPQTWVPQVVKDLKITETLTSIMNNKAVQKTLTTGYKKYLWVRYGREEYRRRLARAQVDLDFHWSTAYKYVPDCQTQTNIIIPWIANYRRGMAPDQFRITFNLCEYVHGDYGVNGRPADMMIDPRTGCKTLADPEGYSLKELQARAVDLKNTLEEFGDFVNLSSLAVAGLIAWRIQPVRAEMAAFVIPVGIRVLNAALFRTALALVTMGGAVYAVNENYLSDAALRDLTDVSDSINQAVNGRFVINGRGQTMVPVSMPIEKFAEIWERFLSSARERKVPAIAPTTESRVPSRI